MAKKIRYAVVGLGHIAQVAVLPAFEHAKKNSELAALVSGDDVKLRKVGEKWGVEARYHYDDFEECLSRENIDAVYIALPNHLHREYAVRAAAAGVHVLCEKPMAVTAAECEEMIAACDRSSVRLMIAYRLHFEETNMKAVELVRSGKLGEVRLFSSVFTMDVKEGDIRLRKETGGGTLYDIGVYCINAARYLFRDEPVEGAAFVANNGEKRFSEVEEMITVQLRFPHERLAQFICSFGAARVGSFRVVGTEGDLLVDPAYTYAGELKHELTLDEESKEKTFPSRDQFAPQLLYFSDCIINGKEPEPSGWEGLVDVQIIEALYRSARNGGRPERIETATRHSRPDMRLESRKPPVEKPEEIRAEGPGR